jgi:hypothetical protein
MNIRPTPMFDRIVYSLAVSLLLLVQSAFANAFGNWTTNQVSTNRFGLTSVVYGNGCYVAAGSFSDYGAIVSSEDGFNWTVRADGGWPNPAGAPTWGLKVNFANGRFIASSAWGGTAVSTNGTNWALGSAPLSLYLYGATYGNGTYVAVGQLEPTFGTTISNIITSPDGINWTLRRSHLSEARVIADVAYGTGGFVAIGASDGYKYRSSGGATWSRTTIAGGSAISFCNGLFVVPYGAGTNLLSSDGNTFVAVNTGIANMMGKVMLVNNLFTARTGNYLTTSVDGTNWIQYPGNLPGVGLASDGVRLVTAGQTGSFYYNSFIYTSDGLVGLRLVNPAPTIELSGLVGRSYRIDYTGTFVNTGTNNWQMLTNLQLPSNPFTLTDLTATSSPQRFYRAVLLP